MTLHSQLLEFTPDEKLELGRRFAKAALGRALITFAVLVLAACLGALSFPSLGDRQAAPPAACAPCEANASVSAERAAASKPTWREDPSLMDSSWKRWPSLVDF